MASSLSEVFLFIGYIPDVNGAAEHLAINCFTEHMAEILWSSFESQTYLYIARNFMIKLKYKCPVRMYLSGLASCFILGAFHCAFYKAIC